MNDVVTATQNDLMEKVIIEGDLSKLSPSERVIYYNKTCQSMGLNPLTKPFSYIRLNGKLVLYATKDCTEQLRKINKVSIIDRADQIIEGVYIVTVKARTANDQYDVASGAVTIQGLKGEALANAYMKAETKAKRRVTLSICGLGFVDESELESIPDAKAIHVDHTTGEIKEQKSNVMTLEYKINNELLDNLLTQMDTSASLTTLKNVFDYAVDKFNGNDEALDRICSVKDRNKEKLIKIESSITAANIGDGA